MAIVKHTLSDNDIRPVVVYGETANLNYFLSTAVEPDAVGDPVIESVTMPARTRRQYPGDASLIQVSGHQASFMRDPSRTSGSGLPGRPFRLLELTDDDDMGEPGELRQFTFVGAVSDLVTYIRQNSTKRMKLYTPNGAVYPINFDPEEP